MSPPVITDHALVRFIERAGGLDVDALRALMAESLARAMTAADLIGKGNCRVHADGLVYVISNGPCVTVLNRETRR